MTASEVAWMAAGSCVPRADLPWTVDAERVASWQRLTMAVLCDRCLVRSLCAAYADGAHADAGFWAGSHRDTDTVAAVAATGDAASPWVAQPLPGLDPLGGAA